MKIKLRSCGDEITDFHVIKIPEAGPNYIFWLVTLIDSVLKKDGNYYMWVSLKECTYIEKEKRVIRYFTDDLKFSSDESDGK